MNPSNRRRVLAICLEAAAAPLIERLITKGAMPALGSLAAQGSWLRVESPSHIGSGAVWPTFASGEEPLVHGVYGEWYWQPDVMSVKLFDGGDFTPFWKRFVDAGLSVGVFDPPFAKPLRFDKGFEIIEWGPHDVIGDGMNAHPQEIADLVLTKFERHSWTFNRHDNASADNPREMEGLSISCLHGARLRGELARELLEKTRPDFALIVFTEIHHGSHHLWHTSELNGAGQLNSDPSTLLAVTPSLEDVCREIDRQIAVLIETVSDDDVVMVYSLHGMRPCAGVASFLPKLLCEKGLATLAGWNNQSWRDRMRSVFAKGKKHAPPILRNLYYRTLSTGAAKALAAPTILPVYDWSRTRAFSLPTDQHGWIRINLKGRERDGVVPPEEYDRTCAELETLMRSLRREDGVPLVDGVMRTAPNAEAAQSLKLPDVVVHWADSAFKAGQRIKDSNVMTETISGKFTGQHAPDGFCILRGPHDLFPTDSVRAKDMHRLIGDWLL